MRCIAGIGLWFCTTAALSACTPEARLPDLRAIYNRTAEAAGNGDRRPLIAIPGTLGSRLVDRESGAVVWGGGSRGISADPKDPDEYRLIALPIPVGNEPRGIASGPFDDDGTIDLAVVNARDGQVVILLNTAGPIPSVARLYGVWFWVHTAYSYVLIATGTGIASALPMIAKSIAVAAHILTDQERPEISDIVPPFPLRVPRNTGKCGHIFQNTFT